MSLWLAVLKIQLCPHLEGKGRSGGWGVVRPESEAPMPEFLGEERTSPNRAHGRGRGEGTKVASPLWPGHLSPCGGYGSLTGSPSLPGSTLPLCLSPPHLLRCAKGTLGAWLMHAASLPTPAHPGHGTPPSHSLLTREGLSAWIL